MSVARNRLEVRPNPAMIDEPVRIRVHGLKPGRALIRAATSDDEGRIWSSSAEFEVGSSGDLDPERDEPVTGTYAGADLNGLFWSMQPVDSEGTRPFAKLLATPLDIRIEVEQSSSLVDQAVFTRLFLRQGVTRTEVQARGLEGTFFTPPGRGKHPAVVVLRGSGGGLEEARPALLASYGYCSLGLAYFRHGNLPRDLCKIPLEYFQEALEWLREHERVDPEQIAVMGSSRGGELALLLGTLFSDVHAVIGVVPGAVVFGGLGDQGLGCPAWTLAGKGLPFLAPPPRPLPRNPSVDSTPMSLTPHFLEMLADRAKAEAAAIPVERINGPVLLLSATDDQLWPSTLMSDMVVARLRRASYPHYVKHFAAEGAGHLLRAPGMPTTVNHGPHSVARTHYVYGGSPQLHARSEAAAWREVLGFLSEVFGDAPRVPKGAIEE